MRRIIENEINKIIKRYPTDDELNKAIEYLDFWADEETSADDLHSMISDWVDEYMAQCEHCGKWHLKDEMSYSHRGYLCDEVCEYEFDKYNMTQEDIYNEYRFNVLNA